MSDKIDLNKTYRTRKGAPVRLFTVDSMANLGCYPVVGEFKSGDFWLIGQWTKTGANGSGGISLHDLIEVKPKVKYLKPLSKILTELTYRFDKDGNLIIPGPTGGYIFTPDQFIYFGKQLKAEDEGKYPIALIEERDE